MVLHRPVECTALTVHVGTKTHISGKPTYQDLAGQPQDRWKFRFARSYPLDAGEGIEHEAQLRN
jgi:hypothetical protein